MKISRTPEDCFVNRRIGSNREREREREKGGLDPKVMHRGVYSSYRDESAATRLKIGRPSLLEFWRTRSRSRDKERISIE